MKRPTHFMTLRSDGRNHLRPLVRNVPTSRPKPVVDLLAPKPKPKAPLAHPADCRCAPCTEGAERAREYVDGVRRRAEVAAHFEKFESATFMLGPEGSSALDR